GRVRLTVLKRINLTAYEFLQGRFSVTLPLKCSTCCHCQGAGRARVGAPGAAGAEDGGGERAVPAGEGGEGAHPAREADQGDGSVRRGVHEARIQVRRCVLRVCCLAHEQYHDCKGLNLDLRNYRNSYI